MGCLALISDVEIHDSVYQPIFPNFHFWRELPEPDKRVISDPREFPLFTVINGLTREQMRLLDSCFVPLDMGHYYRTEIPWMREAKRFVAEKNHVSLEDVSDTEDFLHDWEGRGTPLRYRLYYAARYPNKIGLKDNAPADILGLVGEFFTDCRHALYMATLSN